MRIGFGLGLGCFKASFHVGFNKLLFVSIALSFVDAFMNFHYSKFFGCFIAEADWSPFKVHQDGSRKRARIPIRSLCWRTSWACSSAKTRFKIRGSFRMSMLLSRRHAVFTSWCQPRIAVRIHTRIRTRLGRGSLNGTLSLMIYVDAWSSVKYWGLTTISPCGGANSQPRRIQSIKSTSK